jgi:putative endonuclease
MTVRNRALGQLGERLAEEHLSQLRAQLLIRNYRIEYAEVDLLMEHEGDLVAVEVKTRAPQDLAETAPVPV